MVSCGPNWGCFTLSLNLVLFYLIQAPLLSTLEGREVSLMFPIIKTSLVIFSHCIWANRTLSIPFTFGLFHLTSPKVILS